MTDFDLFVIGAGSGGVRASRMAAATGARVAVAEERFLGGTCVNVGCVPKKLFYYGANYASDFSDAAGYGWRADNIQFDWQQLRDNKTQEIERLNGIYQNLLDSAEVEILRGRATIVDPHTVAVGDRHFSVKKILIATGGKPYIPEFPGSELAICSDDVFYLDSLPSRVLVVGGGYIAVEFAGIFKGLGVETELSYRGKQLLKLFDHRLGQQLATEMINQGIHVLLESDITSIKKIAGKQIQVDFNDGSQRSYDAILYATGRKANTNNLGLENTNVVLRDNGQIIVDEYFQTSEPSIYALGDIIGTPELTPVALAQAMAFVKTWFENTPTTMDYQSIATAVFSHPNIGTVGLSEQQAREQFDAIAVYESEFRHLKHTLSGNTERTFMKIVVDAKTDKVLGMHMLGSEAGEIVQGLAVAMKCGVTKTQLDSTIGIHPTAAEEFVTMREPVS